jgi:hypothetical protein
MSRFRAARFGGLGTNVVNGELQISGSIVVKPITVTGNSDIPVDTSMVLCNNTTGNDFTLTLPDRAGVPLGHVITFKDSVGTFAGPGNGRCVIAGDVFIDASATERLSNPYTSITLCAATGSLWNVLSHFDGSI